MPRRVAILRTGVANVASVMAAFRRLGAEPDLVDDAADVRSADHLVFPGVGAFGAAMERLRVDGLGEAVRERIDSGKPTLAVCLGMQLLFEESEEAPGIAGLGVVQGTITRFPDSIRVPQFGWNRVEASPECRLLDSGHAYFANSYRAEYVDGDWATAVSEHGGRFVAAFERGAVLACQFHPELSGEWGTKLLDRWLECGGSTP
jgi:imidazole glycerol-phosphate synthase subunit HisH